MQRGAVERAVHMDGADNVTAPAETHIPGAVDHERFVAREQRGQLVGEDALGDAAGVESQSRRAGDGSAARIDLDARPGVVSARSCGRAWWRQREKPTEVEAVRVE